MKTQRRSRFRRAMLVATSVVLASVLAACGRAGDSAGSAGSSGGDPTVPVVLPLTGVTAEHGLGIKECLQSLADQVNKEHLVKSGTLKLDFYDNQSSASTAVSLAAPLMAKTQYMLNGVLVGTSVPVNKLVTGNGPVIYNFSPAVVPEPGSYIFTSSATTLDVSRVAMKWASSQHFTKVALITSTDASGVDGMKAVTTAATEQGDTKIVTNQTFGVTDPSVSTQVSSIAATKPDVVVIFTSGPQIGTVFQALRQNGLGNVPVVMAYSNLYFSEMQTLAATLPTNLYSTGPLYMMTDAQVPSVQQERLDLLYRALGKSKGQLDAGCSYSSDGLLLYVDAINHLGNSATASQIRDYIQGLKDWPGVDGVYHFSTSDHRGITGANYGMVRYDQSSKLFVPASPLGG